MTFSVQLHIVIRSFALLGKALKQEDFSNMCRETHHEKEPLDYYCQECKVCICDKCGQTRHTHHTKVDIQQAVRRTETEDDGSFTGNEERYR